MKFYMNFTFEEIANCMQKPTNTIKTWYYKALNSEYEYLTSDECIIDNIESNDCQYLECGKQYF